MSGKYIHFEWIAYGKNFLEAEFELLGLTTLSVGKADKGIDSWDEEEKAKASQDLRNEIEKGGILFVYSFNYIDQVSRICHEYGVKYISWTYDSPWAPLNSASVAFDTSYIFVFDTFLEEQARRLGAKHVHYLGLASHPDYYNTLAWPSKEIPLADVSFVGNLYEKRKDIELLEYIDSGYLEGFLDGMIKAQDDIFGLNLMRFGFDENVNHILEAVAKNKNIYVMPLFGEYEQSMTDLMSYHIERRATHSMRLKICTALSEKYDFLLYTGSDMSECPGIRHQGYVETYKEAPFAFRHSKINMNMTSLSIYNGIPFRCFEIMASGGFLLSNFQKDFDIHFIEGKHYASFSNMEELTQKIDFYLRNETERRRIARNGYEEIVKYHTTAHRAKQMLEMAGIMT